MSTLKLSFSALLWLALFFRHALALPVSEIRFTGNAVTKEKVLRQELLLHEGDEADSELIEASRQAIMNLGLFKSVTSTVEEDGAAQRLIFTMEERYFFLPIPRLGVSAKNGDAQEGIGSYNYGLELRYDNVMGLNQRLKLVHENETPKEDTGTSSRETSLKYDIPRLIGSPYQLNLNIKQIKQEVYEYEGELNTGFYHSRETSGGFHISRWLDESISRGWTAGGGLSATDLDYDEQSGSGLAYTDSYTLALSLGMHYLDTQEHPYHRQGEQYGYSISLGLPELGSNSSFTRHSLYYRRYQPVEFADSNINTQLQLHIANGTGTTYSIGNSALLRGYDNDYAQGNAMLLGNVEYHHHMSGYRQLRGVLFADIGNAWPSASEINLGHMATAVGIGMRWRVQSFVDVTLRMDYAYALSAETSKLTLNTKASF